MINNTTPSATAILEAKLTSIKERAEAKALERRIALLDTESGANKMLRKEDGKILSAICTKISNITDKPIFTGFMFNSNVETIVAIAQALQFMKGNLRDQIPETIWEIFDADTRSEILTAYGRLPYLAEALTIEINGSNVVVDPTAVERARAGIKPNVEELNVLVNTVAMNLDLLGEYNCTQNEANTAWASAVARVAKAEILDSYKDSL